MLNPRILIIEDDADLRQKLTTVLEFLEYQPIACDHQFGKRSSQTVS